MKLAIIVPYRNRKKQLDRFIKHLDKFFSDKEIEYHIFVIEQEDDKPFNQGKLLNIGFDNAIKGDTEIKLGTSKGDRISPTKGRSRRSGRWTGADVKLTPFRKIWT